MPIPNGWELNYVVTHQRESNAITSVRGICPYCRIATTFQLRASQSDHSSERTTFYLIMQCNHAPCRKTVYVATSVKTIGLGAHRSSPGDPFFMHPSGAIDPAHPSIPPDVAEDWLEAQRSLQGGNQKAAAVMLRRVLYGVLIDKGCKLHPLRDGMQDLITGQRLPAVFDEWLPAIRDDGHDGAHPDRALKVSTDNVAETTEYTAELLRYLYVEPYEFQKRKARNSGGV